MAAAQVPKSMITSPRILLPLVFTPFCLAAQDWSLAPSASRFESGFLLQDHRRTLRYTTGYPQQTSWGRRAVYLRARVNSVLAVELNGLAWHLGSTKRFPDRDYFQYTIGAGVTMMPLRAGPYTFGLGAHLHAIGNLDQSPSDYDKRHHQLAVVVGASRGLTLSAMALNVWAGPVYAVDWLDQYPPRDVPAHARSEHNLGGALGGGLLLAGRLRISTRIGYFTDWQTQVSGAVVF
jgi:hypothetical protein